MRLQQQLERQASKGENISVAVLLSDDDDDQSARTGEKEKDGRLRLLLLLLFGKWMNEPVELFFTCGPARSTTGDQSGKIRSGQMKHHSQGNKGQTRHTLWLIFGADWRPCESSETWPVLSLPSRRTTHSYTV